MNKAIFLDRDGTINSGCRSESNPKGFMWSMRDLHLIPGAAFGINLLNNMNYKTIVISNQSGVGRGLFTEDFVDRVHERISNELALSNAYIDAYYYCPHHPTKALGKYKKVCDCRKPKSGMIFSATEKYNICLHDSYFIGDGVADIRCALNAKVKPILVFTGDGIYTINKLSMDELNKIEYVAQDLLDASQYIFNKETKEYI